MRTTEVRSDPQLFQFCLNACCSYRPETGTCYADIQNLRTKRGDCLMTRDEILAHERKYAAMRRRKK